MNFKIEKPITLPAKYLLMPTTRPIIADRFQFIRAENFTRDNTVYALCTTMPGYTKKGVAMQRAKFRIDLYTSEAFQKYKLELQEQIMDEVKKEMKGQEQNVIDQEYATRFDAQVRQDILDDVKKEILKLK